MPIAPIATALYTAEQVRRIDRAAIADGIPGFELMRRAATAAFASLHRRWPAARRIAILAGRGNNGGDAFLVGKLALEAGRDVCALALAEESGGDAGRARGAFLASGGRIEVAAADTPLPDAEVYVDGLFGTGLDRPVEGVAAALIGRLNARGASVLALDLPSGIDADSGSVHGIAVRAAATVSFVAWKRGLFTGEGVDVCGEPELAMLDIPDTGRASLQPAAELLDTGIDGLLPSRKRNVNKGNFGHVLAIGGDAGMGGAIRLAGEAALRVGAGLVSVATRGEHVGALNAARPELMARGVDGVQTLAPMLGRADVLALGPGLGQGAWSHALWHGALDSGKPVVIDADALNLLAREPRKLSAAAVLTPHPGEAARLLVSDVATVQRDRFGAVQDLARRYAAVVVLKGAGSLIADPSGRVAVCPWGNPGMASGGMGDLLTGAIAGLLAQGLAPWDAARLGVALHARAGDVAAGDAPRGLLAGDLFAPLRALANRFDGK